ncbi:MAG: transglutaminase domain-containing protein [Clostridiales bacterium]|nr:transglutaminase domain-containing protein [Clostridiales bacterium]
MVKHEGNKKRIKLQIVNGTTTYTYDLNNSGTYEAFPLQMGDGTYTIRTLENVLETTYSVLYSADVTVALSSSLSPYLYPSQRVRFNSSMEAVKKSYDLTVGLTTDEEKVNAIYNYVFETIKYDYSKVSNLTSTYLSNADTTLANKAGICLDYSVLMAVMLRTQGIPTQVVYGSATEASWHAWNKIYYNGTWVLKDATFAAGGGKGTNYTESQRY